MTTTNPYASPTERVDGGSAHHPWTPIIMGIFLYAGILFARYRIAPIYQTYDTELSPATLLAISPWTPAAVLVGSVIFSILGARSKKHWHDVALILIGFVCIVGLVAFYVFALMVPFIPIETRLH